MYWLKDPTHRRWLESEADRLLEFARGSRHPAGGFAWLDDLGKPLLDRPVELWITCRMTHVFALGQLLGRPGCGPLVDHGVQALHGLLHDPAHGGWFAAVDNDGPSDASKETYGHAFVVLAGSSAAATGHRAGRQLLDDALQVMDEKLWSDADGMVVDRCDQGFTAVDPYRGVNANMHTVEAFLAASDVTGDPRWRERALRITERVVGWRPRPGVGPAGTEPAIRLRRRRTGLVVAGGSVVVRARRGGQLGCGWRAGFRLHH